MPYRIALPPDIAAKVGKDAVENIPDDVKPETVKAQILAKFGQQARETLGPIPKEKSIIPELVGLAPALIPGEGLAMAAARPAVAAGLRYGAEKLTGGKDPEFNAIVSAAEQLFGEALGGLGRAGTRAARAALDKTVSKVASLIGQAIPEFAGENTAETINRVVGGAGMKAVSADYGATLRRLWKENVGGELPEGFISEETRNLVDNFSQKWPAAARKEWVDLQAKYANALAVSEWMGTPSAKALVEGAKGHVSVPELQAAFMKARQPVSKAVPGIEQGLRMPPTRLGIDEPGRGLGFGAHVSPGGGYGYLRQIPRAPRMTQEGLTPELVSTALRALGAGGFAEVAESAQ